MTKQGKNLLKLFLKNERYLQQVKRFNLPKTVFIKRYLT